MSIPLYFENVFQIATLMDASMNYENLKVPIFELIWQSQKSSFENLDSKPG